VGLWLLIESLVTGAPDSPGIPFRVRVGVTGHRTLHDPASVRRRVETVLGLIETELLPHSTSTPVVYTVVSALAEGADRLVPEVVLERNDAELDAVLPLARAEFRKDFQTDESRAEFDELLARALQPPSEPDGPLDRPHAYAAAGRTLVDRSDVLIAVWDHEPARGIGGTASIVEYARKQKVPTYVVSTADPDRIDRPTPPPQPSLADRLLERLDLWLGKRRAATRLDMLSEGYRQLDAFNRERLPARRLEAAQERERGYAAPVARELGTDDAFAAWALPAFVRADVLAGLHQWIYTRIVLAVFMFAAGAVTIAAAVKVYAPEHHRWILLEVGLMVAVALFVSFARWKRSHDRWISYRSLAENLRSAPFIALIGAGELERELAADPFMPWFQRAFTEIWKRRPQKTSVPDDPRLLARFLDAAWIGGQIAYHEKTSEGFNRRHRGLTSLINALFLATFVAALIHAFAWIETETLVFLAISLPAFGAALSGYRELRQFGVHSERYRRAKERLEEIRVRMLDEDSAEAVKARAARAYTVMLEENIDWFGVVEFADLEIVI
jgi:hypothetical protein